MHPLLQYYKNSLNTLKFPVLYLLISMFQLEPLATIAHFPVPIVLLFPECIIGIT